jgi:cytochrome c oxidase subunit 2
MEYDPIARGAPMFYLFGKGVVAREIAPLLQGLLALALFVVIVTSALAFIGALRRRSPASVSATPLTNGAPGGLRWITVGVGLSSVVLLGFVVWSTITLAAISHAPSNPAFTVKVTAQRWWWAATYQNPDVAQIFTTANEIHIPVGETVRFELASLDVIHSFWVPSLAGKLDVIPGQTNVTWLKADRPGVYRGQCTNYCGQQHSHMGFAIIADPPEKFEAWRRAQIAPAGQPQDALARDGETVFLAHCATCHAVRGARAGGRVGPDLTHIMSRKTLAAGVIPNNAGWLSAWVSEPQHIKSGSRMPNLPLSGTDLAAVRAYLVTLK